MTKDRFEELITRQSSVRICVQLVISKYFKVTSEKHRKNSFRTPNL